MEIKSGYLQKLGFVAKSIRNGEEIPPIMKEAEELYTFQECIRNGTFGFYGTKGKIKNPKLMLFIHDNKISFAFKNDWTQPNLNPSNNIERCKKNNGIFWIISIIVGISEDNKMIDMIIQNIIKKYGK